MNCRISFFFLVALLWFTSCITTSNMKTISVEILKPAILTLPDDIDTIAVFNRNLYKSDTITFRYFDVTKNDSIFDRTVHYRNLSNKCVDALANYLDNEGYFLKVNNYTDSLNYLFKEGDLINYPELLKKLKVDACIFLDFFKLDDILINNNNEYYYTNSIIEDFPEFSGSTKFEKIKANLFWTISVKGDTSKYFCRQPDDLYYGNAVYPDLFGNDLNHRNLLQNTAEYLGRAFGAKMIPSWLKVERSYYRSSNTDMRNAEKYCLTGEWLKAADIYNRETKNRNRNIAAKAKYNMALVCEMEGNLDAAIDWLILYYSAYKWEDEEHKDYCKQYIDLLAERKTEIKRLEKQVRNRENKE